MPNHDAPDDARDAARWRAFAASAQICTEGPNWHRGGYWFSGPVMDEPRERAPTGPTPNEYGDALVRWMARDPLTEES